MISLWKELFSEPPNYSFGTIGVWSWIVSSKTKKGSLFRKIWLFLEDKVSILWTLSDYRNPFFFLIHTLRNSQFRSLFKVQYLSLWCFYRAFCDFMQGISPGIVKGVTSPRMLVGGCQIARIMPIAVETDRLGALTCTVEKTQRPRVLSSKGRSSCEFL